LCVGTRTIDDLRLCVPNLDNLNIYWTIGYPFEADAILLVNSYALLAFPIAYKRLQAVSRRDFEFVKQRHRIQ
jgi:hypothetical protein